VFRRQFANRNVLVPPDAASEVVAAITMMTSPDERHRWLTSMASSQALAQSAFGGLSVLGRLDALEGLASDDGQPVCCESAALYRMELERQVSTLSEPRPTSLDAFFDGPQKVAVEVEFTEAEFGCCSRPRLRPEEPNFERDRCDGNFSIQRGRSARCSLSERGILYWQFMPRIFTWSAAHDHRPCPLAFTYPLVRNVLAACMSERGVLDTKRGHVLLVYDARNPAFQAGGEADAQWWTAIRALRHPRLLRRVSCQRVAAHLTQFPDLAWLSGWLAGNYGF